MLTLGSQLKYYYYLPVVDMRKGFNGLKGANHQGYMWVYRNPLKRLVLFKYNPSRGQSPPKEILKEFKGTLQTDGYKSISSLSKRNRF